MGISLAEESQGKPLVFGSNPVQVKLRVSMGLQAGMLGLSLSFTYGKLWPKLKT